VARAKNRGVIPMETDEESGPPKCTRESSGDGLPSKGSKKKMSTDNTPASTYEDVSDEEFADANETLSLVRLFKEKDDGINVGIKKDKESEEHNNKDWFPYYDKMTFTEQENKVIQDKKIPTNANKKVSDKLFGQFMETQ
jgi:hypothetical protein